LEHKNLEPALDLAQLQGTQGYLPACVPCFSYLPVEATYSLSKLRTTKVTPNPDTLIEMISGASAHGKESPKSPGDAEGELQAQVSGLLLKAVEMIRTHLEYLEPKE
jgi:hypothetical protein